MSGMWERKFTRLSDPQVATAPFTIHLDEDKCIGCGVCVRQCPCQTLALVLRAPSEQQAPACQYVCPCGVDIRHYLKELACGGSIEQAWETLIETNPMPAVTGRVCPHPCESGCNRGELDGAVNINKVEAAIGDYGIAGNLSFKKQEMTKDERVAVIGAGPGGMSCAYHLARNGYRVTVFEAREKPGGMLRYAIPRYRLPENIIDREMQRIIDLGLEMRYGNAVGKDISLETLKKDFQAVYIAIGAWKGKRLNVPGEEAAHVHDGLSFLRFVSEKKAREIGERVVVIGGGNTAIDAARTARRLGAQVTVLYRRSLAQMPASAHEVKLAGEEGVAIEFLCTPVAIDNRSVKCIRMQLGEKDDSGRARPISIPGSDFTVEADTVLVAVGQELAPAGFESLAHRGRIDADENFSTTEKGVFAGGDAVTGPATVSQAIGAGRKAALAIDAFLQAKPLPSHQDKKEISYKGIPLTDYEGAPRAEVAWHVPVERLSGRVDGEFAPLSAKQVKQEADRCFGCGTLKSEFVGLPYFGNICIACHNCEAICPHEALSFPNFYKVDRGHWTTEFDYPAHAKGFPNPFQDKEEPGFESLAPRITEVERVIFRRRSNRVFKPDQVPKEIIARILEAGRFAPSAGNGQPWKFVVVRDRQLLDEISAACTKTLTLVTKIYQGKDIFRTLIKNTLAFVKADASDQRPMAAIQALTVPKFGREDRLDVFFGAPTVIYVLVNKIGISKPILSTGMCCQNMVLAAHAMGMGTCYSGFGGEPVNLNGKLKKKLGLKWPYDEVATTICIGYPAVPIDKPVAREYPGINWIE